MASRLDKSADDLLRILNGMDGSKLHIHTYLSDSCQENQTNSLIIYFKSSADVCLGCIVLCLCILFQILSFCLMHSGKGDIV